MNTSIHTINLNEKLLYKLKKTNPTINIACNNDISELKINNKKNNYLLIQDLNKSEIYKVLKNLKSLRPNNFSSVIFINNQNLSSPEATQLYSMGVDLIIPSTLNAVKTVNTILYFIAKDFINPVNQLTQKQKHIRSVETILKGSENAFKKLKVFVEKEQIFTFSGELPSLQKKNKLVKLVQQIPIIRQDNFEFIRVAPPVIKKTYLKEKISFIINKYSRDLKVSLFKIMNQRLFISGKISNSRKLNKFINELKEIKELKSIQNRINVI